jgi:hypothetical protein
MWVFVEVSEMRWSEHVSQEGRPMEGVGGVWHGGGDSRLGVGKDVGMAPNSVRLFVIVVCMS